MLIECYEESFKSIRLARSNAKCQYADDMCCTLSIEEIKSNFYARQLEERTLIINKAKTEVYKTKRRGDEQWMKCKYLPTLLQTSKDIVKSKISANDTMEKIKHNN